MNGEALKPHDPKLTAYALGELSGDERAAVEAALREHPDLRAAVEEIRATVQQLTAALEQEPIVAVPDRLEGMARPPKSHARNLPRTPLPVPRVVAAEDTKSAAREAAPRRAGRRRKIIRLPQFYYVVGGLAAACFAVMVTQYRDEHNLRQDNLRLAAEAARARAATTIVAVPLGPLPPAIEQSGAVSTPNALTAADETALRPTFIGNRLALAEQNRAEPVLPRMGPGALTLSAPASSSGTGDAPAAVAERTLSATTASAVGTNGVAPVDAAVPTTASVPTLALAQSAPPVQAGGSGANFGLKPDDEIVLLDAFTVRADFLQGFTTLSRINRTALASRGLEEHRNLPRPPAAAQFARNVEAYTHAIDNEFVRVAEQPRSTFAANVDTASYANVRRMIEQGTLPPRDAVRIEELLNYFSYRYAAPMPERGDTPPFAASLEVSEAPWAPAHRLVRIGLKSREVSTAERPPANLVFLIDVSASMSDANKLPLVKESMRLLVNKLRNDDRVALVVYAGASGLALPSTPVAKRREILDALEALTPGGSTNGAMGIHLAYDIAKAHFIRDGINRVILCTDGDFNVGVTHRGELVELIGEKAESGVFLTVLGFGMGNLKDATLESLAQKGNGNYGYIDSRREAEKLLVEQISGTLVTVAKDMKIQVEFNPAKVASYRLIGYENRQLRREDFNHDQADAGEIGAGHTVTALYEVVPHGVGDRVTTAPAIPDLKYQAKGAVSSRLEMPIGPPPPPSNELLTVTVRYKRPDGIVPRTKEFEVVDAGGRFATASPDFRFAAAVAQFGMILRDSPYKGAGTLNDVVAWAATAARIPRDDPGGYRDEFIDLVRKTQRILLR